MVLDEYVVDEVVETWQHRVTEGEGRLDRNLGVLGVLLSQLNTITMSSMAGCYYSTYFELTFLRIGSTNIIRYGDEDKRSGASFQGLLSEQIKLIDRGVFQIPFSEAISIHLRR